MSHENVHVRDRVGGIGRRITAPGLRRTITARSLGRTRVHLRAPRAGAILKNVFERMTDRGRAVITNAQELARVLNHNYVGTEHILYGLLQTPGTAAEVLQSLDITAKRVHEKIDERDGTGNQATGPQPPNTHAPFVPQATRALELAHREALSSGSQYIDTEHILLGVIRENDSRAARILHDLGADPEKITQVVITHVERRIARHRIARRPPHAPGPP